MCFVWIWEQTAVPVPVNGKQHSILQYPSFGTCLGISTADTRKLLYKIPFFHSSASLTTGLQPLPLPVPHTVRSGANSSNFQYPLFFLRSSRSCLRFSLVFSSLPTYFLYFLQSRVSEGSSYARCDPPVSLPSFYYMQDIYLLLSLPNISSLHTRSVQLISLHPSPATYFRLPKFNIPI